MLDKLLTNLRKLEQKAINWSATAFPGPQLKNSAQYCIISEKLGTTIKNHGTTLH
jgi:hypothetical protein